MTVENSVERASKVGKILIGNKRDLNPLVEVEDVFLERLVGRSVLANPFVLKGNDPKDRQTVIEAFEIYFQWVLSIPEKDERYEKQINFMFLAKEIGEEMGLGRPLYLARMGIASPKLIREKLNELEDKLRRGEDLRFVCWCYPLPCHVELIRDYLVGRLK